MILLVSPFTGSRLASAQTDLDQNGEADWKFILLDQATPSKMYQSGMYKVSLTLQNKGNQTWKRDELVFVSYHWLNEKSEFVVFDGLRTRLTSDVPPEGTITVKADIKAPAVKGNYKVQWDMVIERKAWFSDLNPNSRFIMDVHIQKNIMKYVWMAVYIALLIVLVKILRRK